MAANRDIDTEEVEVIEEEEEEEEAPRRGSPLRIILLVLLILVLLCVGCFVFFRNSLPFGVPGMPPAQPAAPVPATSETSVAGQAATTSPTEEPSEPAPQDTTAAPTTELLVPTTEQPAPTSEQPLPTSEQPVPTSEQPLPTSEQPSVGTEQPIGTEQPLEQPLATVSPEGTVQPATQEPGPIEITETPGAVEPTDDMGPEHDGEMPTTEPGGEVTPVDTTAVPGPTATPTLGATPDTTTPPSADCANNTPPVAEAGGPYEAMMGKGDAFVTVDGSGSSDTDGTIDDYTWDFGDGSAVGSGVNPMHGYGSTGSFVITLTITDNCGATAQDTTDVTIVGPTPPATGTVTVTSTVTATPIVTSTPVMTTTPIATATATLPPTGQGPEDNYHMGTLGFCYRVQYGNTLSGIAWYFGVPWPDLAMVNGVSPEYYVIEGQGLFIPTEPIQSGPNLYQVETGDTMYSIAYQCGLPVGQLAWANGMSPDQVLTPGEVVAIPPWGWH